MADIELVIKIPEAIIKGAKDSPNYYPSYLFEKIWRAIVNGNVLPKGHGRLIDADKEIHELNEMKVQGENFTTAVNFAKILMRKAPTIIEADRSEE